jgi:hypothetical protein
MNVLANLKGSVGRWNLNFWRLEQFLHKFLKQGCCRHLFQAIDLSKTNKETTVKQQK